VYIHQQNSKGSKDQRIEKDQGKEGKIDMKNETEKKRRHDFSWKMKKRGPLPHFRKEKPDNKKGKKGGILPGPRLNWISKNK
jgi:hypothetical protein